MADPAKLKRFEIRSADDDYVFHIESEDGQRFEILATHDQLDVLADHLDDVLLRDEAADEVSDGE